MGGYAPIVGEATLGLLQWLVEHERFPETEIPRLRDESLNVLRECAPPSLLRARRTGLVCGYVQSGKTASMETVSALARDNGFRIIVLLAGVTTNLVEQSQKRMEHLQRGAGGYDWLMLNNPRRRDVPEIQGLLREWRTLPRGGPGGRTLFITVMKQSNHLQHLATVLTAAQVDNAPAIIFDDEADQASLNTRPLDPAPSTIYTRINELRAALPHHTLLQYTATPQAPLLISRIDSLSADFAEVISPGSLYTGGQVFFRERRAELTREIPASDAIDPDHLPDGPPASLQEALAVFFVGVASEYCWQRPTANRSMLIHPHHTRPIHDQFLRWTQRLQNDWAEVLASSADPDRDAVLQMFQAAHQDLTATEPALPAFEEIADHLLEAVQRTSARLVNSNDGREVHWDNAYAHILVGGEKLGRGYTVKGLTVTYMPRGPGTWNADTIQQRARFFGYHSAYLGLCRVYLQADLVDVYEAYLDHEEDVRSKIQRHRGQPLQQLKRAFILDADLRPTRHNVLARLYQRPLRSEWFEQRWPHATTDAVEANRQLVARLMNAITVHSHSQHPQHNLATVNLRDLVENYLSIFICPDDRDETSLFPFMAALNSLARREPNAGCLLLIMSGGEPRARAQDTENRSIDLMQGRSSAGADRYPGDRAFFDDNVPTLQIHTIRVTTGARGGGDTVADNVPALALRLPSALRQALDDVIVQPDH